MYTFKLFTIDSEIANEVKFKHEPTRDQIENLLWYVDAKESMSDVDELMKASGDDVFFNTVDENGFDDEDDDFFGDGVYATLERTIE